MKRISKFPGFAFFPFIFLMFGSFLLTGCSFDKTAGETASAVSVPEVSIGAEYTEQEKEGTETMELWFSHTMTKIQPDSPNSGMDTYRIYLAKNETESCQFTLRSDTLLSDLTITLSPFASADGQQLRAEILREYYIETQKGVYYPDPVAPVTERFTVAKDKNQPFLMKLKTTAETVPGRYSATLKILQNGSVLAEAQITATVWDFALPAASHCATAVGLYPDFINKMHGITVEEKQREMYRKYYDFLLEHKICAYTLPYDILDERADFYLDDDRVTNFIIPYSGSDDTIRAYYEKLSQKPEWFAKGVFYPLDEPTSAEHINQLKQICQRLDRLYPDYQLVTPFFRDIQYSEELDQIDAMTGLTNVWCPKSYMYISKNIYTYEQARRYAPFGERMAQRKAAGDRIWWYVCWEPGDPYCNLFVDMQGIMHRLLFWQQKLYDVDGFLYWGADFWAQLDDPWTDMRTVKDLSMDVFGDGSLLYNGDKAGIDGAAGSVRLEAIRDGIEDFDMFTLGEQYLGHDFVMKSINEITTSVIKYTRSDDEFANARIKFGNALEQAIKIKK